MAISDEGVQAWAKSAGLDESKVRNDPKLGLLISLSGIPKLVARRPDDATGDIQFLHFLCENFPRHWKDEP